MRYLRTGHVTVFFSPFLAIIALSLISQVYYVYDGERHSIITLTEASMLVIGVQVFGLILCLLGIRKGDHIHSDLTVLDIFLILWGIFATFGGLFYYSLLPEGYIYLRERSPTIWDNIEYATPLIAGLLWTASGIILYTKVVYENAESKRKRFLVDPRLRM